MNYICLIGFGAIGESICTAAHSGITSVIVRSNKIAQTQSRLAELGLSHITVSDTVPPNATLVLECAGHSAIMQHVIPALERGVVCAVLSVGALSTMGLPEQLEVAAKQGQTQVHLLSGAIGGIDGIAAAKIGGLTTVTYTGRKPPRGWLGSAADIATVGNGEGAFGINKVDLLSLTEATIIFEATARLAATAFPKNSNVAATVALAGLGLDATTVRLIADPTVTENIHEILATGAFGEMRLEMRGKPLASNPKTSALTVLSALRFLQNHANAITI